MKKFKLSDIQTTYILDTPLRRLVSLEVNALRKELGELKTAIAGFQKILGDEKELHKVIDKELAEVSDKFGEPRKALLLEGDLKEVLAATAPTTALEVADDPCTVYLSNTGLLARTATSSEESTEARKKKGRSKHDGIVSVINTSARNQVLLVTNKGRAFRVNVIEIPALPDASGTLSLKGASTIKEVVTLTPGETVISIAPMSQEGSPGLPWELVLVLLRLLFQNGQLEVTTLRLLD